MISLEIFSLSGARHVPDLLVAKTTQHQAKRGIHVMPTPPGQEHQDHAYSQPWFRRSAKQLQREKFYCKVLEGEPRMYLRNVPCVIVQDTITSHTWNNRKFSWHKMFLIHWYDNKSWFFQSLISEHTSMAHQWKDQEFQRLGKHFATPQDFPSLQNLHDKNEDESSIVQLYCQHCQEVFRNIPIHAVQLLHSNALDFADHLRFSCKTLGGWLFPHWTPSMLVKGGRMQNGKQILNNIKILSICRGLYQMGPSGVFLPRNSLE